MKTNHKEALGYLLLLLLVGIVSSVWLINQANAAVVLGKNGQTFVTQYNFSEDGVLIGASFNLGPTILTDAGANPIGPNHVTTAATEEFSSNYTSIPITGGGAWFQLWYHDSDLPAPNPRVLDEKGVDPNAFGGVAVNNEVAAGPPQQDNARLGGPSSLGFADRVYLGAEYSRGYHFFQSEKTQLTGQNQAKTVTYSLICQASPDHVNEANLNSSWVSLPPGQIRFVRYFGGVMGGLPDPVALLRTVDNVPGTGTYTHGAGVGMAFLRPYNNPPSMGIGSGVYAPSGTNASPATANPNPNGSAINIYSPSFYTDDGNIVAALGGNMPGAIRWFIINNNTSNILSNAPAINIYRRGTATISGIPVGGFTGPTSTWPQIRVDLNNLYPAHKVVFLAVPRPGVPANPAMPRIVKVSNIATWGAPGVGPIPAAQQQTGNFTSVDVGLPPTQAVAPMTASYKIDATTAFAASGNYSLEIWVRYPFPSGSLPTFPVPKTPTEGIPNTLVTALSVNTVPETIWDDDQFVSRSIQPLASTIDANTGAVYGGWALGEVAWGGGPGQTGTWVRLADSGTDFLVRLDAEVNADIITK